MNTKIRTVMEWLRVGASGAVEKITAFLSGEAGKDSMPSFAPGKKASLGAVLDSCRGALLSVAVFSGIANLLMLTGALFMMEVYDRVLPSRSLPTLVGLSIVALVLFIALGTIEIIRGRILTRCGGILGEDIGGAAFRAVARLPLLIGSKGDGLQPTRDLDTVRGFLMGAGPVALFDLPWIPIYLAAVFILHPYLGLTALIGAAVLAVLTLLTERRTKGPMIVAARAAALREGIAQGTVRNAEAVAALRMTDRIEAKWRRVSGEHLDAQREAGDVAGTFGAISKVLRLVLQAAILAVGAVLVIGQQASPGVMIAGSLIGARALAPVDGAIAQWKGFVAARQAWARLEKFLDLVADRAPPMALPAPRRDVAVESVSITAPGGKKLLARNVSFDLSAGQGIGVVGSSGSGKSTLLRGLVGLWPLAKGNIRMDGAALDQWSDDALGRHIGYLPQDIELFHGSVAENIARFDPAADPAAIAAAAQAAGVHDLILKLSDGYETDIGEQGSILSGGQRQRIALARALYGDPFLIVLDEPNSNLDAEGEEALARAIRGIRARGGIVVVATHRPRLLAGLDRVLMMKDGAAEQFTPVAGDLAGKSPVRAAGARVTRLETHAMAEEATR